MKPEIELIKIAPDKSGCGFIGQKAVCYKDNGLTHALAWDDMKKHEWGFNHPIYTEGEVGYIAKCLALFVGEDKDGFHCYVTYDPDF